MKDYVIKWLKGILSAAIGGAANGIASIAIAPETFNITTGLNKLLMIVGFGAVLAVANYLKQSPLPVDSTTI